MRSSTVFITAIVVAALAGEVAATEALAEGTGSPAATPWEAALATLEAGDAQAAMDTLHAHLREHPEDRELALRFSLELGERGLHELRLELLGEVLSYDSQNYGAALEMGALLKAYRRFDEAIPYFELIPEVAAGHYSLAQLNLADSYRVLGRFVEAREAYLGLVNSQRYASFASAGLCTIELSQGRLDNCRQLLDSLSENERASGVHAQADLLLAYLSGQTDRCRQLHETIRSRGDEGVLASAVPILLAIEAGETETAATLLEARHVVSIDGEHTALLAIVAAAGGDHEGAQSLYSEAIGHNTVFAYPHAAAAILLWRAPIAEIAESLLEPDFEETPPPPASHDAEQARGSGCCRMAPNQGRRVGWPLFCLATVAALSLWRNRRK